MEALKTIGSCKIDILFTKSVPHILETIFEALDYESYKACLEVSKAWKKLLRSVISREGQVCVSQCYNE